MNGREGFKAINTKVIVLPKRDLNHKLKLVSNEDWEKKVWIFLSLALRAPLIFLLQSLEKNSRKWYILRDIVSICFQKKTNVYIIVLKRI